MIKNNLGISFCISTDFSNIERIKNIILSIKNQNIDNYEILICGGINDNLIYEFLNEAKIINFNEFEKPIWITKKKNILSEEAKFEYMVFMHDYISLENGWYEGFKKFIERDNNWSALCNKIKTINGNRWRLDWVCLDKVWLDYEDFSNEVYASGAYFITKKSIMTLNKFDESLGWNQLEDVIWSRSIKSIAPIKFNPYSSCILLKQHREG